jgi:DNA-binding NtrC family response regulator
MRKQPVIETNSSISVISPARKLTVLSLSPHETDHLSLQTIIGHSKWMLFTASNLASTISLLQDHEISVLLCERDLLPGTWIDVLEHIMRLPNAPSLIVASRLADDRLWAEALNLGAWDVLAKPFDHIEVIRSVKSAWQRWHDQMHPQATAARTMAAAS